MPKIKLSLRIANALGAAEMLNGLVVDAERVIAKVLAAPTTYKHKNRVDWQIDELMERRAQPDVTPEQYIKMTKQLIELDKLYKGEHERIINTPGNRAKVENRMAKNRQTPQGEPETIKKLEDFNKL